MNKSIKNTHCYAIRVYGGSSTAPADTISRPNFNALSTGLDFQANGSIDTITRAAATARTVSETEEQALVSQSGRHSLSVRLEHSFKRNAGNITSASNIPGGATLLKAFETAFGFCSPVSEKNIDIPAKLLTPAASKAELNISRLQNAAVLNNFLQCFTANCDA